jgi:hypothetical protein
MGDWPESAKTPVREQMLAIEFQEKWNHVQKMDALAALKRQTLRPGSSRRSACRIAQYIEEQKSEASRIRRHSGD